VLLLSTFAGGRAERVSPLYARGYAAIPEPQKVLLSGRDFLFADGWQLELGRGVEPRDIAVESLKEDLKSRDQIVLTERREASANVGVLHLAISPRSVEIGEAADADKNLLAEQAYRIDLRPTRIDITANAPTGLFYGVQTLLQLVKPLDGGFWLPGGQIVDWPDLQIRIIYWDDSHHLERLDVLKDAVRRAAFFKANGFAIKLEGHFQYKHAQPMVEPNALSPAQLQELTDYALRYHVQLIPYLDAPAHIAFILKHPEYATLRAFPESNFELCTTNPDAYKLLFGMYEDLLEATRGAKYFLLSTDEPWYVGLAHNAQCNEATRAKELGSVGKVLAEFVAKAAGFLHDHGRTVIFWGEDPLKPDDIASLPTYLINGEVYGPKYDPVFKAQGIRQMVYVWTQGEEPLFPEYYILPSTERLHPSPPRPAKVQQMFEHISLSTARQQSDLMGVFVAGWGDEGVHPESFWLGYATIAAYGWHPGSPDPSESMSAFYPLFYGPGATSMGRAYELMSLQAQFWADSWETAPTAARKPMFGNSYGIFNPPRPARAHTLPLPPVPTPDLLRLDWDWSQENARRVELASRFLIQNDELLDLLHTNLKRVQFNRYNLEVFLSIAQIYRQNLLMILELERLSSSLKSAQAAAPRQQYPQALAALDEALDAVEYIRQQRNGVIHNVSQTWYKTWLQRVAEANGRRFLHVLDDVQNPPPALTIDMSYLVYRELLLPLGDWAEKVLAVRNQYAQAHGLPLRNPGPDWKDTTALIPQE
jgi:hypothetical protein